MEPSFQHQNKAVGLLREHGVYALIMEQGTGKSRPVIDDWLARVHATNAQDLVVLAPKGCYMNWIGTPNEPGEIDKWVPPEVRKTINVAAWISGANKKQTYALDCLLRATGP